MKKIFIFFCSAVALFNTVTTNAQSYSIEKDTVRLTYIPGSGVMSLRDSIIVPASSTGVTVKWNVTACNFPTDWITSNPGICDNHSCYGFGGTYGLWPVGTQKTSDPYLVTGTHDFHLQVNLPATATTGCYYANVKLTNIATSTDTNIVFSVCLSPAAVQNPAKATNAEEVSLYPNPATEEINVVFDANADVKTIAIFNNIGRVVSVYKVNGNSANMSLENMSAGIYFVRLVNGQGEVVATRKFTKQ